MDFSGHDYGNVMYSPVGSTTAETIIEESEVPFAIPSTSKTVSHALGASAIKCMTGIACSLATSHAEAEELDREKQTTSDVCEEPNESSQFAENDYSASNVNLENVEDRVQQLLDNMPDYTNVSVGECRGACKYTSVQI